MAKSLLELKEVDTHYGIMPVLKQIGATILDGESVFVVGVNGAGKSTLLRTISGLVMPSRGKVLFQGQVTNGLAPEIIARMGIAHVPEGRRVFGQMTVMENLEVGAYLREDPVESINSDLNLLFSYFPVLKERRRQVAHQLSGGEQQMLAIARALMAKPSLLLLDEPSLGLSPLLVERLSELILEIRQKFAVTIFIVEQNIPLALEVSSRGYVMQAGQLVASVLSKDVSPDSLARLVLPTKK